MASSIILALPGHQDGAGVLYYSLDSVKVNLPSSSLGAGVCRRASCRFAMRLEHSRFVTVIRNHGFSLFSCVLGGRKSFTTGLSIIDVVLSFTCMERLLIHHQELEKMAAAALTGEECSPTRHPLTSQLAHAARARLIFSSQDRDIDFSPL